MGDQSFQPCSREKVLLIVVITFVLAWIPLEMASHKMLQSGLLQSVKSEGSPLEMTSQATSITESIQGQPLKSDDVPAGPENSSSKRLPKTVQWTRGPPEANGRYELRYGVSRHGKPVYSPLAQGPGSLPEH